MALREHHVHGGGPGVGFPKAVPRFPCEAEKEGLSPAPRSVQL